MKKPEQRAKAPRKTKYCTDKQAVGRHTKEKLETAIEKLKTHKGTIHPVHVKEYAHEAGTLPSLLYAEYYRRLTNGITELSREQTRERAKEYGRSVRTLYDLQYLIGRDVDHANPTLKSLLVNDEATAVLYKEMSHPTAPPSWSRLKWEYVDKPKKKGKKRLFKKSDAWFYTRFMELIQDPHLGKGLQAHYGNYLEKKPAVKRYKGDRVEMLFQRLDEADELVGLYDENGKPKALPTLDRALRKEGLSGNLGNMYPRARNKREWRVWEDAVEEWKQTRAEDEEDENK